MIHCEGDLVLMTYPSGGVTHEWRGGPDVPTHLGWFETRPGMHVYCADFAAGRRYMSFSSRRIDG